ncbi:unnamed protein product, partial [marine sediment metagenome]
MESKEILKFCIDKGFLIDLETLNLLAEANDGESIKLIIEKLKYHTQKRIITKNFFEQNREQINEFFLTLPQEKQKKLEKLKINLGLQIEISKEISSEKTYGEKIEQEEKDIENSDIFEEPNRDVKVLSKIPSFKKKIEIDDFVKTLRNRFYELKNILQERQELENLVSINKLSQRREKVSIIGIISEKRITKNKNILFEVEDLTGRIRILINQTGQISIKR